MRNLIHYCSNISNTEPCIDMVELIKHEYRRHGKVLNRWVDYLPFEQRRVIYDDPGNLASSDKFPRYISLDTLSEIMRFEFVIDFGKYLHKDVYCAFVYKHGNKHEINVWDVSKVLLGDTERHSYYSTSRDILFVNTWGHVEKQVFDKWLNDNFKTSVFGFWG